MQLREGENLISLGVLSVQMPYPLAVATSATGGVREMAGSIFTV